MKVKLSLLFLLLLITKIHVAAGDNKEYREKFTEGNYLLLEQNYPRALKLFLEAYAIDSTNSNINYKIGLCYLKSATQKNKALAFLKRAAENVTSNYDEFEAREKKAPEEVYNLIAQSYHLNYMFKEAITYFEKYKDVVGSKNIERTALIDREIEMCYNGIEFMKKPVNVEINNIGDSINTPYPEYSPVISADESILIFTSRRPGSTGGEKTISDQFYEDIYICHKQKNKEWSDPSSIGASINTAANEASIALSADGSQLFIYKDDNGGDIYSSTLDGDNWSVAVPLGSDINSSSWETHACLSSDGNTLYFVSDRKGGFGGRDIWRCVKLPNGNWSLATNLGPAINTPLDEDAPFIHPDGVTLFFSSQSHKTMGGFDIFFTTKNEDGNWNTPTNAGYPINTTEDDIFYVVSSDGKRAYYSSAKAEGFGDKDIYVIALADAIVEPITLLKGYLTYNRTNKTAEKVKIMVTDQETGAVVQEIRPNSKTGKYIIALSPGPGGQTYTIRYETEGFQPHEETINVEPGSSFQEIEKEIDLKPINLQTLSSITVLGKIRDSDGKTIGNAKINITDNITGKLLESHSSDPAGKFNFIVEKGGNYNISYEAEGYLFRSENINIPKDPSSGEIETTITLEPIKEGAKIVLNNIFFEQNKAIITKSSTTELENLHSLLKNNPELKIEVAGHTDNKGDDLANLKLSQSRAQAVVNYLVKKGIDKKRLVAKGYGETQPIAPNTRNGKPDPAGMKLNRRVELKILDSN